MERIKVAYDAFCKERFPLPSEQQVTDLEERIGISLPPDFRKFVHDYNGGVFSEPDIRPTSEGCPEDRLTILDGIGASHPYCELASESSLALFDDNDPLQILPFGYTLMGNLLYLVTHPDGRGHIGLKKAFFDDSYFLACGIAEFFELLRQPEE